jgi:hypothetical protein
VNNDFKLFDKIIGIDMFSGFVADQSDNDHGLAALFFGVSGELRGVEQVEDHLIGHLTGVYIVPPTTQIDFGSRVNTGDFTGLATD